MKGILIDPFTKTVTEMEGDFALQDIDDALHCETITAVRIGASDCMFLDDEGLLKPHDNQEYFYFGNSRQPFAGRALVLGTDDEGGSTSPKATVQAVRAATTFLDKSLVNPDDWTGWTITTWE